MHFSPRTRMRMPMADRRPCYAGGWNTEVRRMPAARPLPAITRAIFRDASSIISSPSMAEPLATPPAEGHHSEASRSSTAGDPAEPANVADLQVGAVDGLQVVGAGGHQDAHEDVVVSVRRVAGRL